MLLVHPKPVGEDNLSHLDYDNHVSKISHIRATQWVLVYFHFMADIV